MVANLRSFKVYESEVGKEAIRYLSFGFSPFLRFPFFCTFISCIYERLHLKL
jgi:hypothetical protein